MKYYLITTNQQLLLACENLKNSARIAFDTEFLRIKTYYPHLGLLQLYAGEHIYLVDPLLVTDWAPFIEIITSSDITKIFHACSEDLEVFEHFFGTLPVNIVDSQVLAAFTGHPLSSGYIALVKHYFDIELNKEESRSNWLARPLSIKQLKYAAADVFYLLPLVEKLLVNCTNEGWIEAAYEESETLLKKCKKQKNEDLAYLTIKNSWMLDRIQLARLQLLATWRLKVAQQKDLALNFVVREEVLLQLAKTAPTSLNQLVKSGVNQQEARHHGKVLLKLVKQADRLPTDLLPQLIKRVVDQPNYKHVFRQIKNSIEQTSHSVQLRSELLASRRQINQLLKWHWQITAQEPYPELLSGWRGKLLQKKLLTVLDVT